MKDPTVDCDGRNLCRRALVGSAPTTFAYARGWAYPSDDARACADLSRHERADEWMDWR